MFWNVLLVTVSSLTAQIDSLFSFNGVPCAADTVTNTLYCPVAEEYVKSDNSLSLKVDWSEKIDEASIDGISISEDSLLITDAFHGNHLLRYRDNQTDKTFQLVFTLLPVVQLDTKNGETIGEEKNPALIRILDPYQRTNHSKAVKFDCNSWVRGATSKSRPKKSYGITLTFADGEERDESVLGIRTHHNWILDAMAIDRSRMRNRVIFDIWNEFSQVPYMPGQRNGTSGYYVELLQNGRYCGLYVLSDKINRKLLGLKKYKAAQSDIRGVLYKSCGWTHATCLLEYENEPGNTNSWEGWEITYPDLKSPKEGWTPLVNLIDFIGESYRGNLENFIENYDRFFYKDNLLQYACLLLAFNLRDNLAKNVYFSCRDIQNESRFLLTPWDLDCSLGGDWNGDLYDKVSNAESLFSNLKVYHILWDFDIDHFHENLAKTWNLLQTHELSQENLSSHLRTYANLLIRSGAWNREYDRWQGKNVYLDKDLYTTVEYMENWYSRNLNSLNRLILGIENVNGKPNEPSRAVYTLDGRKISDNYSTAQKFEPGIYIVGKKKIMIK